MGGSMRGVALEDLEVEFDGGVERPCGALQHATCTEGFDRFLALASRSGDARLRPTLESEGAAHGGHEERRKQELATGWDSFLRRVTYIRSSPAQRPIS